MMTELFTWMEKSVEDDDGVVHIPEKAVEWFEKMPSLELNTGHGKNKYSDRGLASVFELHLKEVDAPFHEAPDKVGWFLTTKVALTSWLESRSSSKVVSPEVLTV